MIQALHRAGFKVIMDVVYNHMYSADNWFERMTPGYFCRRTDGGALANGSGCGCDMASEHAMFGRYIVDSVTYWAREYHIDGFRFDLMGLIDVETMNAVRASVDALPNGRGILLYGEPWSATDSAVEPGTILANKGGVSRLGRRIGWFCDATRDSIKGHVLYAEQAGFVNGLGRAFAPSVRKAVDAWHGAVGEPKDPMQLVQYVSAHDDLTLWDKLCATMCPGGPTEADYAACGACGGVAGEAAGPVGGGAADDAVGGETGGCHGDVADMLAANAMAAGLVMTAAGLPFLLSGEEFARTKLGCSDSFDRPASLNLLDWRRAVRMAPLDVDRAAAVASGTVPGRARPAAVRGRCGGVPCRRFGDGGQRRVRGVHARYDGRGRLGRRMGCCRRFDRRAGRAGHAAGCRCRNRARRPRDGHGDVAGTVVYSVAAVRRRCTIGMPA